MQTLLNSVATELGVGPATLTFGTLAVVLASNAITRAIPDNATGWRKWLRLVTKVIGVHIKDNSGIAAMMTDKGAVRVAVPGSVPEGVDDSEPELLLDDRFRPDPFKRGAAMLEMRAPK